MLKKIFLFIAALGLSSFAFAETANHTPEQAPAQANVMAAKHVDHSKKMTNDILVHAADVEMTKRGQTSTEVKMEIINHNKQALTLVAASSPAAHTVELHEFTREDGHEVMRQIHQIKIPAHGDEKLSFSGFHVMLINLVKPLHAGEMVPVILSFSDGSKVTVKAKVVKEGKKHHEKEHHK